MPDSNGSGGPHPDDFPLGTPLAVVMDGDNAWPDLAEKFEKGEAVDGAIAGITALPNGTSEGRCSIALRIELADGKTVIAQTTARLLAVAIQGLEARHGSFTED